MNPDFVRRGALARRLALMILAALPGAAGAAYSSSSSVGTPAGFVRDTGSTSSAVTVDAANYASSFVSPQTATLGAAAANAYSGSLSGSGSRSSYDDFWSCSAPCGIAAPLPNGVVPLSLDFSLDGVLTNLMRHGDGSGDPSLELRASYTIGVFGSFDFLLQENVFDSEEGPLGAGSSRNYAHFCRQGATVCSDLPIDVVAFTDSEGNDLFRFSLHAVVTQVMCPNCAAGFVDEQSIQAEASGGAFIDALHTFKVGVRSEDPNFQFASANGRTTADVPPVSAVPEPETLPLLLAGLAAVGAVARRRGRASRRD
ncbi:MAG TPA: PEP-CTERM sorting domain-containing protein [Caldimonas sp.]|nr:PEP-CTERM sorting domain-containing protein [Caldimonas sp.]